MRKAITIRRLPTTTQRSSSIRSLRTPTITAAWRIPQGRPGRALADLDEAIRLDPKYADPYTNRGDVWSQGDFDRAIADYDEALRLNSRSVLAFSHRGIAYYYKGDYDRAIADYDEAIRLNPKYAAAYTNRGRAWYGKHDYDRALADLDKAIRLDPKDGIAYTDRGEVGQRRIRPRHCRFRRGDPAQSESCRRPRRPRGNLGSQGRLLTPLPTSTRRSGSIQICSRLQQSRLCLSGAGPFPAGDRRLLRGAAA